MREGIFKTWIDFVLNLDTLRVQIECGYLLTLPQYVPRPIWGNIINSKQNSNLGGQENLSVVTASLAKTNIAKLYAYLLLQEIR